MVDRFSAEMPDQFLNCGIAEQLMSSVAAGMSIKGDFCVYTYSIANFPTLRCLEQIRNDICYHNANVKVVTVGSGLAYGTQGYTHFGIEDANILNCLPNIVIATPSDPLEAMELAKLSSKTTGPWLIRLGKNKEQKLNLEGMRIQEPGQFWKLRDGKDVLILGSGAILEQACMVSDKLRNKLGISVISHPFLKPILVDKLVEVLNDFEHVLILEENIMEGGLYSMIYSQCGPKINCNLIPLNLAKNRFLLGSEQYLRNYHQIDADAITQKITSIYN